MAQRYWESTYNFSARADVPFQYVCGNCGRIVLGVRSLDMTWQYRKTTPFRKGSADQGRGGLALTDEEQKVGDAKARA